MKGLKEVLIVLFLGIGLVACNTSTEPKQGDENTMETNTDVQEPEPELDAAMLDSISTKVEELESELDDILDGLE